MGRKAILKNLVDIVVMLKQEDDLDEKDKKSVAQMRELESLYGDEGDADEVEGLMRVRNAGRKTQQDTSRNLIDSLGQAGEKAVQQARSSQQQPPKTSPSSDYTDESALEEGHAYNRQTGKRLIPEGSKFHPRTGKSVYQDPSSQSSQGTSSQPSIPTVSPIPTPTPSESSTPTSTPTPSATPTVTPTPTPTATPKPEPTAPPKVEAKYAKESPFSKAIFKHLTDIVLKETAYREQFPYVPQAYHDDYQDSGGAMSDTTPRKRGKKHWNEPDTRAGWDLEGEDTPPKASPLHPNIGTDNWSVQAADEKELKRFPPNI